ncbi:MAG: dTDP-4-dehydrorhamnose reductase, partial [Epulopiscium sp. Nele67-Bin005]
AILKQVQDQNLNYEIISTDVKTLDISNLDQVKSTVLTHKPDVIINCAAYTAVDNCETDVEGAYKVNAIGPRNLAVVAEELNAKLVHVSTDYVFKGESLGRDWREDDQVEPQSIYGTSKLMGEKYIQNFSSKYFIVRTAWLYGEGNNFVRTMIKLAQTNPELKVVNDQVGNPTSTKDLAIAILNLAKTELYGIYHGTCEGTCSWYDFACKIFEIKGIDIKVTPVTSEQFIRPAKRPAFSSLENFMLECEGLNTFRRWEDALEDYLQGE